MSRHPGGQKRPQSNVRVFEQPGSRVSELVTTCENNTFSTNPENAFRSLKLNDDTSQPQRPAFGTQGAEVILFANYLELTRTKQIPFHRYSISVLEKNESDIPKGQKLKRLIQLLITEQMKRQVVVTDYSSIILSNARGPDDHTFSVLYRNEDNQLDSKGRTYKIRVQYNTTLDFNDLLQYLSSTRLDLPEASSKQDIIQAINIIIGHGLKGDSKIMSQAQKYFSLAQAGQEYSNLGSGIDLLRGYLFSIRSATSRILLNVQVRHAAVYHPQFLKALYNNLEIGPRATEARLKNAEHRIKGLKVKIIHFKPYRNKKIMGFAHPGDGVGQANPPKVPYVGASADQVQFWDQKKGANGAYTTVAEYFHRQYNLGKSNLPVVNTGSRKDPKYTIAEVCEISSGTCFEGRLDSSQSSAMISFAVRRPTENASSITGKGYRLIETNSLQNLQAFGLNVSKQLIQVKGRVLRNPPVSYARNRAANVTNGGWNLRDVTLVDGKTLPKWSMLFITIEGKFGKVENFGFLNDCMGDFANSIGARGVRQSLYKYGTHVNLGPNNEGLDQIGDVFRTETEKQDGVRLFVVLLPNDSSTIYNAVKKAGDIDYGMHTICAQTSKFYQWHNDQYYQNIGLKINLKLGGRNHELSGSDLAFIAEGKTMLVGLDVTHPAPGEDKAPSIACIVASVDKHCAQWPAESRIQTARTEMVQILKAMLKNRLECWREKNKSLPEQLLIYRDGVGEGQYDLVRSKELSEIREACKETYSADQTKAGLPRITIVIVGKRHNTRLYPTSSINADRGGNIKNGTVVDRGVTEARIWDFFLAAHAAIQGTTRPAHYVVVHDEIFRYRAQSIRPVQGDRRTTGQRAADSLEAITHNLCYLYGRATKAVSICPPAYYADLACERARRCLSRFYSDYAPGTDPTTDAQDSEIKVHPRLEHTMFYI